MAHSKRLRGSKYGTSAAAESNQTSVRQSATLLHPQHVQPNKGIARSHAKHQHDNAIQGPTPLSLADRFHALPTELRLEIFSLLLVQPVKWALEHDWQCPLFSNPTRDIRTDYRTCARCCYSFHTYIWRKATTARGGWAGASTKPWRSKYAPRVTNDFMCSDCWDEHFRADVTGIKFPKLDEDMPCLCARRTDLDILLVCRKWYQEASRVLWASNTFAFRGCELFTSFATACTARDRVTKISILNAGRHHAPDPYSPNAFQWQDWDYHKKRQALIAALRQLPALTHLELDACLLRDAREVQAML